MSELSEHAAREARNFILEGETELPDDYPVYAGYAYVLVFEDGEVLPVSSPVKGTVLTLKHCGWGRGPKPPAQVRRCELIKRQQMVESDYV